MGLSSVVPLNIVLQSTTLTREGFGTLLILDYHQRTAGDLVQDFTSLKAMTDKGFLTTDLAYRAAQKVFAQNPRPSKVRIGRRTRAPEQVSELTPATAASTRYAGQLSFQGGSYQDWEFTSSPTANTAEILAGIKAAIDGLDDSNASAATATGRVVVSASGAGAWHSFANLSRTFSNFEDTTSDEGIADDLADIEQETTDYYGVVSTSKGEAEILALSNAIEARRKFFVAATMDKTAYASSATTDVVSQLKTANNFRTAVLVVKGKHMDQPDAAVMGMWLPYPAGSETVHLKSLRSVDTDRYTDTEFTNLTNKNALFFTYLGNASALYWGKAASGEYMDTVRFVDWLYNALQVDVAAKMQTTPGKVPFTDAGIDSLVRTVQSTLLRGVTVGGLSPDTPPTVTAPAVADVDPLDKAARKLTPLEFEAVLAGAIHIVEINGSISV